MSGIIQGLLAAIFKASGGITPSSLFSWGIGPSVGQNTVTRISSPVQVGALATWTSISAAYHVGATTSSGTLFTWGTNTAGQLGHNERVVKSSPVQVGALTNWSLVACGCSVSAENSGTTFAVKTDGTLWGWGNNDYGAVGDNSVVRRSSPVQIGALTDWVTVSTNGFTSFAIDASGKLYAWGNNTEGELGLSLSASPSGRRSSPVQVGALTNWASVSASGYRAALAIKTDNTLWSWGTMINGISGRNSNVRVSSPVQVGALTDWDKVKSGGAGRHCVAVKTDNTLWSWGANYNGQLGQNISITIQRSSPVQIGALSVWSDVSAGRDQSLFLRSVGSLWSCGLGSGTSETGLGDTINRSSPVQIGALTDWLKPAAGVSVSLCGRS